MARSALSSLQLLSQLIESRKELTRIQRMSDRGVDALTRGTDITPIDAYLSQLRRQGHNLRCELRALVGVVS